MIRHFSHIFFTDGRTFTASTSPGRQAGRNRSPFGDPGGPTTAARPRYVASFFLQTHQEDPEGPVEKSTGRGKARQITGGTLAGALLGSPAPAPGREASRKPGNCLPRSSGGGARRHHQPSVRRQDHAAAERRGQARASGESRLCPPSHPLPASLGRGMECAPRARSRLRRSGGGSLSPLPAPAGGGARRHHQPSVRRQDHAAAERRGQARDSPPARLCPPPHPLPASLGGGMELPPPQASAASRSRSASTRPVPGSTASQPPSTTVTVFPGATPLPAR